MSYGEWQGGKVEPIRIGRFLLNPPWIKASPTEDEIAITLDSGVVFGNGGHPTTQACLEAMEIACRGNKTKSMLDLGSGTGVLALAGAKLGCERVLAVDYNFLATRTARTNVAINDLEQQILVINGRAEEQLSIPTDLLVANIHYDVMKELVKQDGFYSQKWFVLSGLLTSEAAKILEYLKTRPVLILKQWGEGEVWHTILGITQ
jgi:ribosomal protein L11 methyltransferase